MSGFLASRLLRFREWYRQRRAGAFIGSPCLGGFWALQIGRASQAAWVWKPTRFKHKGRTGRAVIKRRVAEGDCARSAGLPKYARFPLQLI
jgi:hypothetical protein